MILTPLHQTELYRSVHPSLLEAAAFIRGADALEDGQYPLSGGAYATIKRGTTRVVEPIGFEAHRRYIDIHCLLKGRERILWRSVAGLVEAVAYSPENDTLFYEGGEGIPLDLSPHLLAFFFPDDGHKPNLAADEPATYRKVVIKLPVLNDLKGESCDE